jgi:hypothetical protein
MKWISGTAAAAVAATAPRAVKLTNSCRTKRICSCLRVYVERTHTTVEMTIGGGRARPCNVSIVSRGGGCCESRRDDNNNNNNDDDGGGNNNNSYYGKKNSLYRNMMSITTRALETLRV